MFNNIHFYNVDVTNVNFKKNILNGENGRLTEFKFEKKGPTGRGQGVVAGAHTRGGGCLGPEGFHGIDWLQYMYMYYYKFKSLIYSCSASKCCIPNVHCDGVMWGDKKQKNIEVIHPSYEIII